MNNKYLLIIFARLVNKDKETKERPLCTENFVDNSKRNCFVLFDWLFLKTFFQLPNVKQKSLLMIFVLLFLSGCEISRQTKAQVTQIIAVQKDQVVTCQDEINRCALLSPYETVWKETLIDKKNQAQILNIGMEALAVRLHLIRAAKKSIDIQSFIWVNDDAGHLVIKELLMAAKRGVQVRVIIDQLFSMGNSHFVAEISALHKNLSFRVYNPVLGEAHTSPFDYFSALACCLAAMNKRMHNKVFVVDGQYGMVGGRNYQSRYYDWDQSFNYKDRDVLAIGPEVTQMVSSFNSFWNSEYVVPSEYLIDVARRILNGKASDHDWQAPPDDKTQIVLAWALDNNRIQERWINDLIKVERLEFYSDPHDKPFNKESRKNSEHLTKKINEIIKGTHSKLLLQTPYLVFTKKARKIFKKLRKDNPNYKLVVSTNSLASTDAYYVYAISFKYKRFYLKELGMSVHEFRPRPADWQSMFVPDQISEETRFGMHSKSFVVDDYYAMIGSHNFDPRSDYLNTEAGFIIESKAFAKALTDDIERDTLNHNSWLVAAKEQIPFFSDISGAFATLSRKLPFFDIWPFRYATSYELKPDHQPVTFGHPDFYQNYEAVGNFPGMDLPLKQIQTIIISAFGGFAEPVM